MQLRQQEGKKYFGVETEFSCPLTVRLFMGLQEPIDKDFLKEVVEKPELVIQTADGKENTIKLAYEFVSLSNEVDTITRRELLERQFNSYSMVYKKNNEEFGGRDSTELIIPYPTLSRPIVSRNMPYLSSYLSLTDGILSMDTYLDEVDDQPTIRIRYVPSVISEEALWQVLQKETWQVKMKDGSINEVEARMKFDR
jgi:hypothetical protein